MLFIVDNQTSLPYTPDRATSGTGSARRQAVGHIHDISWWLKGDSDIMLHYWYGPCNNSLIMDIILKYILQYAVSLWCVHVLYQILQLSMPYTFGIQTRLSLCFGEFALASAGIMPITNFTGLLLATEAFFFNKIQNGRTIHAKSLHWRHNGRNGVSNHQPHDCLLNRFFRSRSKKISKLRVTGLCAGNSPVTGEFLRTNG